jgi:hypothetical protein
MSGSVHRAHRRDLFELQLPIAALPHPQIRNLVVDGKVKAFDQHEKSVPAINTRYEFLLASISGYLVATPSTCKLL